MGSEKSEFVEELVIKKIKSYQIDNGVIVNVKYEEEK
jgi:hypothetical protein